MNILRRYNRWVGRHPLFTLAMTSASGMAVGNILCQTIMYNQTKTFSLKSVAHYATYGFFISGPFMRYWWFALDLKIFKNAKPLLKPLKMTILDQLVTPFALNALFLYYLAFVNGHSHKECVEKVNDKLMPVVIESMKIWPAAILLNFYLIPLNYRVLFSNSIAILWTCYFTYMVSHGKMKVENTPDKVDR